MKFFKKLFLLLICATVVLGAGCTSTKTYKLFGGSFWLENSAEKLISGGEVPEAVCAYVFAFLSKTFSKLAQNAREQFGDLPIVWAGGVMSNKIIQSRLSSLGNCYFTKPEYSSDNAVGTALLARKKYIYENGL